MNHQALIGVAAALVGLWAGMFLAPGNVPAQEINFARIGAFESMGSGTVRGASPPKAIVDDHEQHAVFLTIWQSDTEAKVYWKPLGGGAAETSLIQSGRIETRTGLRMMPTFPRSSLSFRTAGFPRYGWKAGI